MRRIAEAAPTVSLEIIIKSEFPSGVPLYLSGHHDWR